MLGAPRKNDEDEDRTPALLSTTPQLKKPAKLGYTASAYLRMIKALEKTKKPRAIKDADVFEPKNTSVASKPKPTLPPSLTDKDLFVFK